MLLFAQDIRETPISTIASHIPEIRVVARATYKVDPPLLVISPNGVKPWLGKQGKTSWTIRPTIYQVTDTEHPIHGRIKSDFFEFFIEQCTTAMQISNHEIPAYVIDVKVLQ